MKRERARCKDIHGNDISGRRNECKGPEAGWMRPANMNVLVCHSKESRFHLQAQERPRGVFSRTVLWPGSCFRMVIPLSTQGRRPCRKKCCVRTRTVQQGGADGCQRGSEGNIWGTQPPAQRDLQGWVWRQVWARRKGWSPLVPAKQFALAAACRDIFC